MAFVDTMTDAEIDVILERFDATGPKLQRRIIAELTCKAAAADGLHAALSRLANAAETLVGSDPDMPGYRDDEREFDAALEGARAALEGTEE